MNIFDTTKDNEGVKNGRLYCENEKKKNKQVINYLCNWQYTWSLPDPFWQFSGKISQVYFPVNRNSKKTLWGPL